MQDCEGATMRWAKATRLVGQPGWRLVQRSDTHDPQVVVMMVQVLDGVTSAAVTLTRGAPYAAAYVDLVKGFSVYLFCGVSWDVVLQEAPCKPLTASVQVCGVGCDSLVPARGLPCPADNVGTACPVACGAMLITSTDVTMVGDTEMDTFQLSLVDAVVVAPGGTPVTVRISRRLTSGLTCDVLTPETAHQDFVIQFQASVPAFTYLQFTRNGSTGHVYVTGFSMQPPNAPLPDAVLDGIVCSGVFPLDSQTPRCSLVVYMLCNNYTSAWATPGQVSVVSQVIWQDTDVGSQPCSVQCAPPSCTLLLLRDLTPVPSAQPRLLVPIVACSEFALNATTPIFVTGQEQLIAVLTAPSSYDCNPTSGPTIPPVIVVPPPPSATFSSMFSASASASANVSMSMNMNMNMFMPVSEAPPSVTSMRLVGWDAVDGGSFTVRLPLGVRLGDWFSVGDLRLDFVGSEGLRGPVEVSSSRDGSVITVDVEDEQDGDIVARASRLFAASGDPAAARDTVPDLVLLYASDASDGGLSEVIIGGAAVSKDLVPAWAPADSFVLWPAGSSVWRDSLTRE